MDVLAEYYHWPDPITMAVIANVASVAAKGAAVVGAGALAVGGAVAANAALATGVAGTTLTAAGQIQAGQAAAAQAKGQEAMAAYNARVQEQEAEMASQQSLYRQQLHTREGSRQMASLRANMAASGVDISEGSPLLIQQTQATESEMDRLMIAYQGQIASGRAMSQAGMDRLQGSIYSKQAKSAKTTGFIGAGTSLLTGFSKAAAIKNR